MSEEIEIPTIALDKIKKLAKNYERDEVELLETFKGVYAEEWIASFEDENERAMEAIVVLASRLKSSKTGRPTKLYDCLILAKEPMKKFPKKNKDGSPKVDTNGNPEFTYVANWWIIGGIGDEIRVGTVALFNEVIEKYYDAVQDDERVELQLAGGAEDGMWKLTLPDTPSIKKIDNKDDLPSPVEILKALYKKVDLAEAEFNTSARTPDGKIDRKDKKLIECRVIRRVNTVSAKGNEVRLYSVADYSTLGLGDDDSQTDTSFPVFFNSPAWVEYPHNYKNGAKLLILGTINKLDDGTCNMNGEFIYPIRPLRDEPSTESRPDAEGGNGLAALDEKPKLSFY